jgi:hypothetical protein
LDLVTSSGRLARNDCQLVSSTKQAATTVKKNKQQLQARWISFEMWMDRLIVHTAATATKNM